MAQGIYEIVNIADGKASTYIGSSYDIAKRWIWHRCKLRGGCHVNTHLQAAWNKYGEDAFVFSVLEEVNEDMLLVMEQEYLDDYFDRGHCYNIAITAGPAGPLSEETKCKMSEAKMGNQHLLGHRHTEETRRRMSLAHKPTEETRRKMSEAKMDNQHSLGHKQTKEHKHKTGEAMAGPYPAFVHLGTGEIIPVGKNLRKLCRGRGLHQSGMWGVIHGQCKSHKGWTLLNQQKN